MDVEHARLRRARDRRRRRRPARCDRRRAAGAQTALVCKSLLGKAHTVMAEGGVAASLGNVDAADDWQVHFQDTMFGGKYLNNWRMAELHAKEAPDRVRELERWGGVFDRTPDRQDVAARVRRPHATGGSCTSATGRACELIRTLQDKAVHARRRRLHGVHDHAAAEGRRPRLRRLRLLARDGRVRRLRAHARSCSPPAAPGSC